MEQYIKSVVAVQISEENIERVCEWINGYAEIRKDYAGRYILLTLHAVTAGYGQWIVRDVKGDYVVHKDAEFKELYQQPSPQMGAVWVKATLITDYPRNVFYKYSNGVVESKGIGSFVVGRFMCHDAFGEIPKVCYTWLEVLIESTPATTPTVGAVWVKDQYDRLYDQAKAGNRVVCFIDYKFFGSDNPPSRDICTLKRIGDHIEFVSRGHGYGTVWDDQDKSIFVRICEADNVEWLDEYNPAPSPVEFAELMEAEINKLPYTKHLDDGQYNDGQLTGFERGAEWAYKLLTNQHG